LVAAFVLLDAGLEAGEPVLTSLGRRQCRNATGGPRTMHSKDIPNRETNV
jgi:hypothetical protein